jgi:hypothetical protein
VQASRSLAPPACLLPSAEFLGFLALSFDPLLCRATPLHHSRNSSLTIGSDWPNKMAVTDRDVLFVRRTVFQFDFVLKQVLVLPTFKFNQQKSAPEILGNANECAFSWQ